MSCGAGVRIGGGWSVGHADTRAAPPSTDFVKINGLNYRGYYRGTPTKEQFPYESGRASGVVVNNAKKLIVEACDFAAADRYQGLCMNRSVDVHRTSNRHLYLAHNRSMDAGSHSSAGMHVLQGEQYLFHLYYPQGGLFDVVAGRADSVTVRTDDVLPSNEDEQGWGHFIDNAGSRIIDEVGQNTHWVLFICSGKGVGQYREIAARTDSHGATTLAVRKPWRVVPDKRSRVVLLCAYRENILYKNFVDTGILEDTSVSRGVLFWFAAIDNIVAENTFRNLTSGAETNSKYRNPTAWITMRGNTIESIRRRSRAGTGEGGAAYIDHVRVDYGPGVFPPDERDRVWYSVGNIFRGNTARNTQVAAYLHTANFARKVLPAQLQKFKDPPVHGDAGIVMSVIENNVFTGCEEGIQLGGPTLWAVIRHNAVQTNDPAAPKIQMECDEIFIREPVIIE
jgi:hypothetical protein